jgi:6-pyruvoyltetrahydropterin/6-carboxytetrahydropterin synthase
MSPAAYYVATVPFEAARRVEILAHGHRCRRLHGHSFLARVRAKLPDGSPFSLGGDAEALRTALENAVAPLDYGFLNDELAVPTDENLARWLRARLDAPGVWQVGIQSTAHQGADLDQHDHAHVWCRFRFEAAHQLPRVPDGHQCGRMHGHGFEVILHADRDMVGDDMAVDFDRVAGLWQPLHEQLHLACLNDLPGLENPTSEVLAAWIWERLKGELPELSWVTVYETATAGCHYDGQHYRIWKEFRFESAVALPGAPDGDRRRRLHGHSYLARIHLTAPLDAVLGWTVDYGDVKELFRPAYRQLDHHYLNRLEGVGQGDLLSVLNWIKGQMATELPQLDRIDLYETPGCGAVLSWGGRSPALPV